MSVVGGGRRVGCLTKACILTLPHNPPFPDRNKLLGWEGGGGRGVGCLTKACIFTLPHNPPFPDGNKLLGWEGGGG